MYLYMYKKYTCMMYAFYILYTFFTCMMYTLPSQLCWENNASIRGVNPLMTLPMKKNKN